MSNQTAKAATGDNNKDKETKEDCSCVGGIANRGPSVGQQQKASIEINRKQSESAITSKSATAIGGRSEEKNSDQKQSSSSSTDAAINNKKQFIEEEISDSGFLSGPISGDIQTQSQEQETIEKDCEEEQQKQQNKIDQETVLDSGIINESEDEQEDTKATNLTAETATEQPVDQMRLEYNADSAPQHSGFNNLSTTRNASANKATVGQKNASQSANNSVSTSGPASVGKPSVNPLYPNITITNAWEQFYQQNDEGDTRLHLACISGFVDVVAALIRMAPHPCLLNIQNDVAQTPLHLAALTAQPTIVRMLLLAGAEPTVRDRHGNTALHLSCMADEKQCVRALTEQFGATEINEAHRHFGHRSNDKTVSSLSYAHLPADLEIRNYDGKRCVHLAAEGGHIDILRILVSHGADINAREGKSGRTPLHIAIENCNDDLVKFLFDECSQIDLETATYAGLTAYQVASQLNKSHMLNMLEKRGAETLTPPDSDYEYDSSDIEDLDDSKIYDRFGDPRYFVSYNGGNPMTVA